MFRVLVPAALLLALGAGLYFLSEARRLEARLDLLGERNRTLEGELSEAIRQRQEQSRLVAARVKELNAGRRAQNEERRAAQRTMPEGVRLALVAANECLREDGFSAWRFLRAREIDGHTLRDVEAIERDGASLRTSLYLADSVRLVLDRADGTLTMRFAGGERLCGGEREALPAEGFPVVLPEVDGPMWEGRLGYLVESLGTYPEPPEVQRRRNRLDPRSREMWLSRLDRLLDRAETEVDYRIERIAGLENGAFTDVMLLGYDTGRKLALALEARRMTVVLDEKADTVELVFRDGVLRKQGGETTIPADGYRVLLPSVTRREASNAMIGMVEKR